MSSNANLPNAQDCTLLEAVEGFIHRCIDNKKWVISQTDNRHEFSVEFGGSESEWGTSLLISKEYEPPQLTVATGMLVSIPVNARNAISELITRINAVKDGSDSAYFYFDMEDGSLGLVSCINLSYISLTKEMVEHLIDENRIVAEDFTDTIKSVLESGLKPVDAIKVYIKSKQTDRALH